MPNTTRQELTRLWDQANNDLDRFQINCKMMADIYEEANKKYQNRYISLLGAVEGFAQMVIMVQKKWRALRDEKL